MAFLVALGLSGGVVLGTALLLAGVAVVLARGGSIRPDGSLPVLGIVLMMGGAVTLLENARLRPADARAHPTAFQ